MKLKFAGFEVDFAQREIRKRGLRVHLQHQPFQILELLLQRPGELVTREEMAHHLWPDSHVSFERGLNTAMNALRNALGDSSQDARFIETRAGLGYAFVAPVEEMPQSIDGIGREQPQHDCLKGHYFLDKMTEEDTRKGIAYFESALREQESEACAFAGLSEAWCQFGRLAVMPSRVAGERAKEFAIRALSSDSQAPAAHLSMARVKLLVDWDAKGARAELSRSLELDPKSATTHRLQGTFLSIMNDPQNALEHLRAAHKLEPLSLTTGVEHGWILYSMRNFEGAIEQCWKVLTLEPRFWPAQLLLGLAYAQTGMPEEAAAELENAVTCSGRNPITLSALVHLGGTNAKSVSDELEQQALWRYVNPFSYALVHAGSGDTSGAVEWMQRAFEERDMNLLWLNRHGIIDPLFAGERWIPGGLRTAPMRTIVST